MNYNYIPSKLGLLQKSVVRKSGTALIQALVTFHSFFNVSYSMLYSLSVAIRCSLNCCGLHHPDNVRLVPSGSCSSAGRAWADTQYFFSSLCPSLSSRHGCTDLTGLTALGLEVLFFCFVFLEIQEVRKGLWVFFLIVLIGWAGKLGSRGVGSP